MFDRLAPFLQDYIYNKGWQELKEIQLKSFNVLTNTNNNLLISSGTASGKTEAVFLPVLTNLYNSPTNGVGILYISPLKALINDQYERLSEMIKDSNINIIKWHGDVYSYKKDLSMTNNTILQITPESLEAILTKKSELVPLYLSNIKYIIIDEIHYFMSSIRGEHLRCLLSRLQLATNNIPIRIGLSATIGNLTNAAKWLSSGTNNPCSLIKEDSKKRIKLSVNYYKTNDDNKEIALQHVFKESFNNKNIIFTNSRKDVEEFAHELQLLSNKYNKKNIYNTHHASVSKQLKENIENEMKNTEMPISTISTTTLELGIDIGSLDKILQIGCPYKVSSFLQRLGRTGRRTGLSCIDFFVITKENPQSTFIDSINLDLLLTIAIIELYKDEKWVEEPIVNIKPFNLLFQQTLAFLYANGETTQSSLLNTILSFSPFLYISQNSFVKLIHFMKDCDFISLLENNNIILGVNGERLVENYNFYSMFETKPEYIVKTATEIIGSTTLKQKIGTKFWLSGQCWKTISVDDKNLSILVEHSQQDDGINKWSSDGFIIVDDKIFKKAKEIVIKEYIPPYISNDAKEHLTDYYKQYKQLIKNDVLSKTNSNFTYFPWCGTKEFNKIELILEQNNIQYKTIILNNLKFAIELSNVTINNFYNLLLQQVNTKDENLLEYIPISGKYNKLLPEELLKEQALFEYGILDTN